MTTELKKYYEELTDAYKRNEWHYTMNSDRRHNAVIMLVMLENAKKIKMFCGEMSVFRKGFYKHIQESDSSSAQDLMDRMSYALQEFLSYDDSHIDIILEDFKDEYLDDLIIPRRIFLSKLGLDLFYLPEYIGNKKEIPHITYTDDDRKMVRIELDPQKHEAICKIGTSPDMLSPDDSFNKLKELSRRAAV
ncbi:MAG: hypothetical protein K1W02_03215 [Muribaculaceae bacterium]